MEKLWVAVKSRITRRGYLAACTLALAAVIAAYSNHFRNDFHFDDDHTILNNPSIRDIRNIPRFFQSAKMFSATPSHQSYRPLVTTTLAIDYRIAGGPNPFVFHATSFVLFIVQCIAMLFLFRRILNCANPHRWNAWLALFAASWYALHAANAETVNYIIARSEILSTLGAVLALLLFSSNGRARRWALYLVPAAAAVFGKEQGAMTAPLIFLYVAFFENGFSLGELFDVRKCKRVLRSTWPVLAVCGSLVVVSIRLAPSFIPGGTSRYSYLLTQPFALLHYALTFLFPFSLSADTDWKPFSSLFDDRALIGMVFVVCAVGTAFVTSRRRETRPIAFGILWFFLALLPTSSIIPLAEVVNDHRMYFPFVGVVLAAACILNRNLVSRETSRHAAGWMKPATVAGCIVLLAAHAYGTHQRNRVWHSEESLWLDVTQKSPENGRGLMNYGLIQMAGGNRLAAEDYFNRALQYSPNYSYLHINIGILKGAMGKMEDADRHFRLAQQIDSDSPASYFYYARWLRSVNRPDEAMTMARRAVDLNGSRLDARHLMMDLLADRQDWRALESAARETLAIDTKDAVAQSWLERAQQQPAATPIQTAQRISPEHWLDLGMFQLRNGEFADAVESTREAIRLRPDYAAAYHTMCAAEKARGSYAAADAACERAVALTKEAPSSIF